MNDAPVSIYAAANSIEASLIVQLLDAEGIEARIASNALEMVAGEVPFQLVSIPVWVHAADQQRALEVIRDHQAGDPAKA